MPKRKITLIHDPKPPSGEVVTRADIKVENFARWLTANGAQVHKGKNEWEILRFQFPHHPGVSLVYAADDGSVVFTGIAYQAYKRFRTNHSWSPTGTGSSLARYRTRNTEFDKQINSVLLERDGDTCALCGLPLGADVTREHRVATSVGGPDHPNNMALMHYKCNVIVNNMSVTEKLRIRDVMRGYREPAQPLEKI